MKVEAGDYVTVTNGPHTGATGRVDFIDEKGDRALVDIGGGRGGLRWIGREHCYCYGKTLLQALGRTVVVTAQVGRP